MKWHRDKWGHIIGEDGQEVKFRSVSILCSGSKEREELAEANTNLAAAAPALLEALIDARAVLWYQIESKFGPEKAALYPSIIRADLAIKTARGQQ